MGVLSSKTDPRWVSITLRPVPLHSINIHGFGGLWGISGQLSGCPLLLSFSLRVPPRTLRLQF
jgi:hypothetical protein